LLKLLHKGIFVSVNPPARFDVKDFAVVEAEGGQRAAVYTAAVDTDFIVV
jgi:hypothetical protein